MRLSSWSNCCPRRLHAVFAVYSSFLIDVEQSYQSHCYCLLLPAHTVYSSFLIDVEQSYQSGYKLLQTAKKASPSLSERFAIFSREQQHTQKSGSKASMATDLVSYVEFQRNYG